MRPVLKLIVDEATVSRKKSFALEVEQTLGGDGSGADLELPDLPDGLIYLRFVFRGEDGWGVQEHTSGVGQINGAAMRYSNELSEGTLLQLPRRDGVGEVVLRATFLKPKKTSGSNRGSLGNLKLLDLAAIVSLPCFGVAFLIMQGSAEQTVSAPPLAADVIISEIRDAANATYEGSVRRSLSDAPKTLSELRQFIKELEGVDRETAVENFVNDVVFRVAAARRFARNNDSASARSEYAAIVRMLEDNGLDTTQYALRALNKLD